MELPGYDAWKLDTPPYAEMTVEEEREQEEERERQEQQLRDAICSAIIDYHADMDLATVRRIVAEELDRLDRLPGETP